MTLPAVKTKPQQLSYAQICNKPGVYKCVSRFQDFSFLIVIFAKKNGNTANLFIDSNRRIVEALNVEIWELESFVPVDERLQIVLSNQ